VFAIASQQGFNQLRRIFYKLHKFHAVFLKDFFAP